MRRFNIYYFRGLFKYVKAVARQLVIPFAVFQGVRTVLLPTTFDVIILAILIFIALGFQFKWF